VNVGEMQRKLSERATRASKHRFGTLYSLLCNMTWLREAHAHVRSNTGSHTAGTDKESMRQFEEHLERNLGQLREQLKTKVFEPTLVHGDH
jgi:retron-type reverse transcriptase